LPAAPPASEAEPVISLEDYFTFVDDALNGMVDIVTQLGDELANRAPDVAGANSPYAVLTHCLGVMEYWGGHIVAGRAIERDRDAEFRAAGHVEDLVARTRQARRQLKDDLVHLDAGAPPRGTPDTDVAELAIARTQGGALIHIYEELAQHRGQLEVTSDVLRAPWVRTR